MACEYSGDILQRLAVYPDIATEARPRKSWGIRIWKGRPSPVIYTELRSRINEFMMVSVRQTTTSDVRASRLARR
jgi:hypothetical protein